MGPFDFGLSAPFRASSGLDFGPRAFHRDCMRSLFSLLLSIGAACAVTAVPASAAKIKLFDGKSFKGWDGDTNQTFHIKDGMIMGGTFARIQPKNEFLATTARYTNFVLRAKFKLTGNEGFVNSGIQIRSERVPNDSEMKGYQADIGEGWFGTLYDESRRNKPMAKPLEAAVKSAVKIGDWNDYEIRCQGPHIVLKINGTLMVDYTEADASLPQHGRIGIQVHGGGRTEVFFKDLLLEPLP